jgi:hypothetical protein
MGDLPDNSKKIDNPRKKYFDYFIFNIVDYGVNCGLLRSGARHRRALAQIIGNARGLIRLKRIYNF